MENNIKPAIKIRSNTKTKYDYGKRWAVEGAFSLVKKFDKKAKHSDAVMIGILVTKFKMGQIDVKDLEHMAADISSAERCSTGKKVLKTVKDLPNLPRRQDKLPISALLLQKR